MEKSRSLFGRFNNEDFWVSFTNGALQNDPVDEGGWFSQMLASRKTIAEYT
jgi:hypothetical protein